ncbi:MAG: hypothetical protein JWR26_632 [Pedosphaera sp.]|nr:hypothetical protein [Pedosphaera sp.]
MTQLEILLRIAGILHFGILIASASTPRALDWRNNLASLHPFLRRLFWVYGVFIVLVIISFGVITLTHGRDLAIGSPLARAMCAFIGVFWLARLFVQFFVFDARPFLTNWFYKIGYHGLTGAFLYFVLVYGRAALF